jgi:Rod binding domain-containing protein
MTDVIAAAPSADPAAPGSAPMDPKIWEAAKKFEAMAIGQLLAPMFDTVDTSHSLFGGGEAETTWKPMLVDAIGKQIEGHGGFGLAQPVYAAMLRAQEAGSRQASAGSGVALAGGAPAAGTQAVSTRAADKSAAIPADGAQAGGGLSRRVVQSAQLHVTEQSRKPR